MAAPRYIARYDAEPEFWQFLSGLTQADLITELIQNELDAGATRTVIRIEVDRLTCEGNGAQVDEEGWTRLSFIRGAGKDAPRKQHRIGIKNHGLKTCFTVGDEIVVRSGGRFIKQTLYRDGMDQPPAPGAFEAPELDSTEIAGCRIEVPFRNRPLVTTVGEPLEFPVPTASVLEQLFRQACEDLPQRFLGVIRPDCRDRYTIELSHFALGCRIFEYRCGRARRLASGRLFTRTCRIKGEPETSSVIREGAFLFTLDLPPSNHEIPSFFRGPKGSVGEVAWQMNSHGTPIPIPGRLRYPIAYTGTGDNALTGMGVHFSAPFVSDQERHGSSASASNDMIVAQCIARFITVLRDFLVQRHGAKCLHLLEDPTAPDDAQLRVMTAALLSERAIPLARRHRGKVQFGPRRDNNGTCHPVVVPVYLSDLSRMDRDLIALCPPDADRVDPDLPSEFVRLLAAKDFPGWKETHVTFDERDVLHRMQPTALHSFFPWNCEDEWRRCLGNASVVKRCLDVLLVATLSKGISSQDIVDARKNIYLSNSVGQPVLMSSLFIGNQLPTSLASLGMPPLLHEDLADHAIFRRTAWRLATFSFEALFDLLSSKAHAPETRRHLWNWISKNWGQIPKRLLSRIAQLEIWPARDGTLKRLGQLCLPRDSRVADVLREHVALPTQEVVRFPPLKRSGASCLKLRTAPGNDELAAYLSKEISSFALHVPLDDSEVARFRAFEQSLNTLAEHREIAAWLGQQPGIGMARDRSLRPISSLHAPNLTMVPLALLDADMLDRGETALDRVFPAQAFPTSDAIVRALRADGCRTVALTPRLKAWADAARREARTDNPVSEIDCIPHQGRLLKPRQLAFKGNRGDFWADWKISLTGKNLSADEQELYRSAGVTSSEPDPETSREFFRWLASQPNSVLPQYVEQVVRHFTHPRSVRCWWESFPTVPCVLVKCGGECRLLSLEAATRKKGHVCLPDFPELVQAIVGAPGATRVMLVFDTHANVKEPITEFLRSAGVQSLRNAASSPTSVRGDDPVDEMKLTQVIELFCSPKMSNLRKRLAALELPQSYLREHWYSRLRKIKRVVTATNVRAAYRVAGRLFWADVVSGFDESSGVIWIKRDSERDPENALFEALTDRVFVEGVPKFAACVLQSAMRQEWPDTDLPLTWEELEEEQETEVEPVADPTETAQTHRHLVQDPSRNLPVPGPIPESLDSAARLGIVPRPIQRVPAPRRPVPELELAQKLDLKQNQYACHCQACLALRSPAELAPVGSYVEFAEHRQKLIEAHHADQAHAGGARFAGNLVLLCYYHHHQFGNALSRERIRTALKEQSSQKRIRFLSSSDGVEKEEFVDGYVISLDLPASGSAVKLFFTSAHRQMWLDGSEEG